MNLDSETTFLTLGTDGESGREGKGDGGREGGEGGWREGGREDCDGGGMGGRRRGIENDTGRSTSVRCSKTPGSARVGQQPRQMSKKTGQTEVINFTKYICIVVGSFSLKCE